MDRAKLRSAVESLGQKRKPGMRTLAMALSAEDAIRWGDLDGAIGTLQALTRRSSQHNAAVGAWARLREVETLDRAGRLSDAKLKLEAARLIDGATLAGAPTSDHVRAELAALRAVVEARLMFRQGNPASALGLLEATPPPWSPLGPVQGAWLRGQAIYTSLVGRADRALGQHKRALDCFKALGDRYHLVKQHISLAQTFLEGGELDHAELYCDKAAEVMGGLALPQLQALVRSRSGMIALLRGDLQRARTLFAEDLNLCDGACLRPGKYYARRNLGKVLVRLGLRSEGAEYLAASHRGFAHYGDPVNQRLSRTEEIAARLDDQASARPSSGDLADWHAELESMAAFFRDRERGALEAQVQAVRARLLLRQGALPMARDLIEQVVGVFRRHGRGDRLVEFLTAVAAAYPKKHREEAEAYLRIAYREAENFGQYWAASRVLKALDESSESAALDLARSPNIPTGLTAEAVAAWAAAEGLYEQSRSETFRRLVMEARNVARSDITVLILGETGAGKDWLARYLYRNSHRHHEVYRAYNCGAVTESLLEAELFGYEKGAFTGAEQSKVGIFEAADGGTVLLDEVGELSPRAQIALLRVLDQRVVQPVGSTQPREVDVRILAATNSDLVQAVASGRFRSDLYYRLAVYTLRIPPLRERPEDIPLLVEQILERMGDALRRDIRAVDDAAMEALLHYHWPGNLRELDNVLQGAVIRCAGRGRTLRRKHLPDHIAEPSGLVSLSPFASLAEMEKRHIEDALRQARGNQSRAARLLGIHRNTLANKMRRHGIA